MARGRDPSVQDQAPSTDARFLEEEAFGPVEREISLDVPEPPSDPGPRIPPELMQEIFRPTDRPLEPVTTGLPFGPGLMFVARPDDDDETFRRRIADALETSPASSDEVRALARRLREGL